MMEDSLESSTTKVLSSKGGTGCSEESGWTVYFEDFFSNNREYSASSSDFRSSSLVSDAASCAAWKFSDHDRVVGYSSVVGPEQSCKKFSSKKKMIRRVLDDDALQDTASSPDNSPKVNDSKQLDRNRGKKDDIIESSKIIERNELGFTARETESTEMKKNGLCLVPLSLLMNSLE